MPVFDLPGALRRIRRAADLSQREVAERIGVSKSAVAAAESGTRDLGVAVLTRAAQLAGLRLALLDPTGAEVEGMTPGAVRDGAGRRFPAHLDTRHGDVDWWHGRERYARTQPWYTFDRCRWTRDQWRDRSGVPEDHQVPQPGDSPAERRSQRQAAARRRRTEELQRRRAAGELPPPDRWTCSCPAECDELDTGGQLRHADACPCRCDVC